jgi:ketosteroid isomerase-like protein
MSAATLPIPTTNPVAPCSTGDEAEILALLNGIHQAHHDKDAVAIAAPFAPAAAIFNLAPPLVHRGIDIESKQAWLASWATPVDLEGRDFKVAVSGDLAFAYGFLHMSGRKQGAERPVSFWMRETVCLQRVGGGWKIVHEHASVPFYMDGPPLGAFDLVP